MREILYDKMDNRSMKIAKFELKKRERGKIYRTEGRIKIKFFAPSCGGKKKLEESPPPRTSEIFSRRGKSSPKNYPPSPPPRSILTNISKNFPAIAAKLDDNRSRDTRRGGSNQRHTRYIYIYIYIDIYIYIFPLASIHLKLTAHRGNARAARHSTTTTTTITPL